MIDNVLIIRIGDIMVLDLEDWGQFKGVGDGYSFERDGKFYSLLETKKGAYRGNHIHPSDQHTLLLSGRARYIKLDNGLEEVPLEKGRIVTVKAGTPHILLPDIDCITFEWWDGDFVVEECQSIFDEHTKGRIGSDKKHR